MTKKLQECMPLYVGSEGQWTRFLDKKVITFKITLADIYWLSEKEDFKLLLRPLSDMTEEEAKIAWAAADFGGTFHRGITNYKYALSNSDVSMDIFKWSAAINKLRSFGIDCDHLIESGEAIDKTKTPTINQ